MKTMTSKEFRARATKTSAGEHRRNKTEQAFWNLQLNRKRAGEILDCQWEPLNLRLADSTWYRPDCLVLESDGTLTVYEVKGFWRDDARVKIKTAARMFYYLAFVAVQRKKGEWKYEEIPA